MSYLIAIILGLVQGLTEFLPVSSSGHLTAIEIAFGNSGGDVLFNVLLHIATLLALVIAMKKQIAELFKNPLGKNVRLLLLSSVITGIVGLVIDHFVGASGNLLMVALGFFATGVLLIILHFFVQSRHYHDHQIGYKQAISVGIVQGIAVLPGLSRSGSTLCAGVFSGAGQKQSAEFSFLLSFPIILLGMAYELYKGFSGGFEMSTSQILPSVVGFVVAFLSALASIKLMMKLISKNKWLWFAAYLFVAGIVIIFIGLNFDKLT